MIPRAALWRAVVALAVPLLPGAALAPRATHTIVIDQMKFGPAPQGLRVGDTVTWINRDLFRHTATARDGSFNLDLMPGKSGSVTLRRAGSIAFYCTFHPGMRGQFVVGR